MPERFRIFGTPLDGQVETGIGRLLSRAPSRGAFRDRHGRWVRDAMDALALTDERRLRRTAKSCGPDAPMLASSRPTMLRHRAGHGGNKPGSPGRARSKP